MYRCFLLLLLALKINKRKKEGRPGDGAEEGNTEDLQNIETNCRIKITALEEVHEVIQGLRQGLKAGEDMRQETSKEGKDQKKEDPSEQGQLKNQKETVSNRPKSKAKMENNEE